MGYSGRILLIRNIWFTSEIFKCMKNKEAIYRKSKLYISDYCYETFRNCRSKLKHFISEAHKTYLFEIESNITSYPKSFRKYVQTKKGTTRIPGAMERQEIALSIPESIVDAFAHFFKSVYTNINTNANTLFNMTNFTNDTI